MEDKDHEQKVAALANQLKGNAVDTLYALVERGPLEPGDLPSKVGNAFLEEAGLAVRIVYRLEDGFVAATHLGRDVYLYLNGQETNLYNASAVRRGRRAVNQQVPAN